MIKLLKSAYEIITLGMILFLGFFYLQNKTTIDRFTELETKYNKYVMDVKEYDKYMIGSCRGGYEQGYMKALERHNISSDLGPLDTEVDSNCKDSTIENFLEFD